MVNAGGWSGLLVETGSDSQGFPGTHTEVLSAPVCFDLSCIVC